MELLRISVPTLQDWTKLGMLPWQRIGTRVLYKLKEVEKPQRRAVLVDLNED